MPLGQGYSTDRLRVYFGTYRASNPAPVADKLETVKIAADNGAIDTTAAMTATN